jgi:sodium/proline symporter
MYTAMTVFFVYLAILVGLALWSRQESQSLEGYFLAGKKLPYWVVAFSTNATGESGWLLLGLTGMGFSVGAQAYWVVIGEVIGIALTWLLISRRLKRLGDETDSITLPDVLEARFDDSRHILRWISVVIILTMVCAYVTAQMAASGKALVGFIEVDYATAVIVGGIVIIAYTIVGGYKAVSYTDVVQGVMMLAGLIVVPLVAIDAAGGWHSVTTNLAAQDPSLLSMTGALDTGLPGWILVVSFLAIGLPFLGVPQLMTRFMAAKDEGELIKARNMSVLIILLFDVGAVTAGMAGRALFPEIADAETIFPHLARELFHPVITGLLMVVVLSAIMSTVDSLLLLASSAVVRDTMQKIFNSSRSDQSLARVGKVVTVIIGVLGITFAIEEVKFLFWFILFAWSGLGAAFGPVILCMLYYKKTTLQGAAAGMVLGFGVTILWILRFKTDAYDLYEMIPGFFVGLLTILIVSRLTWRTSASRE